MAFYVDLKFNGNEERASAKSRALNNKQRPIAIQFTLYYKWLFNLGICTMYSLALTSWPKNTAEVNTNYRNYALHFTCTTRSLIAWAFLSAWLCVCTFLISFWPCLAISCSALVYNLDGGGGRFILVIVYNLNVWKSRKMDREEESKGWTHLPEIALHFSHFPVPHFPSRINFPEWEWKVTDKKVTFLCALCSFPCFQTQNSAKIRDWRLHNVEWGKSSRSRHRKCWLHSSC